MQELPVEISCQELSDRLRSGQPLTLLDCREPPEHETAALPGSILIPMADVPERVNELAGREEPIVVYCHHGMRSLRTATWLRENGIPQAQSLSGGIDAWSLEIDPETPRY